MYNVNRISGIDCNIITKRKFVDSTYKDKQVLKFNINLLKNQYMNFNSVDICLPIKIRSTADNDSNTIFLLEQ